MKNNFKLGLTIKKNSFKRNSSKLFNDFITICIILSLITTMTIVIIFFYNFLLTTKFLNIKKIYIEGCERLNTKEIIQIINFSPNQNLLALKTQFLINKIKENLWIKDVKIKRYIPNTVKIIVKEKTPIAIIHIKEKFFFMDLQGLIIKEVDVEDLKNLPIIVGNINNTNIVKVLELLNFLLTQKEFPQTKDILKININDILGFSILLTNGLYIQLGFNEYDEKFKKFKLIITDLNNKNIKIGLHRYLLIDFYNKNYITIQQKLISSM